jgi:hypothetical protein
MIPVLRPLPFAAAALVVAAALAAAPARAGGEGGMCAPGRLVSTGDTIDYVYVHCGPPARASTRYAHWRNTTTRVDEWVYDLGDGSFPRLLYFQNGVLTSVGEGAR